jgi:signal transduction histidine kinase
MMTWRSSPPLASCRPISSAPDVLRAAVRTAIGQLESDLSRLRGLITELRPAILDDLGTKAAIEALAERVGNSGLTVDEPSSSPTRVDERLSATRQSSSSRCTASSKRR